MRTLKKRILLLLCFSLCLFLLTGCSFSDLMSWGTGLKQDPDYQTWERLSENGKLDQEGKYTADAIHVTFAQSSLFDMKYYKDSELKNELPAEGCYLLPGDQIYSSASVRGSAADYYEFDHLDVVEYSSDNVREKKLNWQYQDTGSILLIPFDYKGTEVSIEPAGKYKLVTVRLEQPAFGGHVKYTYNGQELTGETADLYHGAKVKGELEEENGWDPLLSGNLVYTVTGEENQVVTFEGKRASEFFAEKEDHKPILKLEANNSLKNCRITVESSGFTQKEVPVGNGGTLIDNQKIGTGNGIKVNFNNFDLESGKNAVRLTVVKKIENGEYKEIHYATKTDPSVQIDFVPDVTYKNVSIIAEAVTAMEFPAIESEEAVIESHFCDQALDNIQLNAALTAGVLGTGDRQIEVQITPNQGYFLTGSFVNGNIYSRKMRFDEYERFVNEALRTQVKKVCTITLDNSDPFGSVVYKVGDKEKTGKIDIEEGKTITIFYTLENKDYEIVGDRNIFDQINLFDGDRFSRYEKTITVDRSLDGQTLTREKYITIKEKEKEGE